MAAQNRNNRNRVTVTVVGGTSFQHVKGKFEICHSWFIFVKRPQYFGTFKEMRRATFVIYTTPSINALLVGIYYMLGLVGGVAFKPLQCSCCYEYSCTSFSTKFTTTLWVTYHYHHDHHNHSFCFIDQETRNERFSKLPCIMQLVVYSWYSHQIIRFWTLDSGSRVLDSGFCITVVSQTHSFLLGLILMN